MPASAVPELSEPVDLRTFARGFARRARQTAWLVGAGGSAEAHVPTARHLIDRLLAELYSSEHDLTVAEAEADPRWCSKAHAVYSGKRGLPDAKDDAFYSAIFKKTFPDQDARARFVMDEMSGATPHYGQHVLGALIASGLAPLVITTNFEQLIEDAARPMLEGSTSRLTVLEPQNAARSRFTLATDQGPTVVKIHGDLGTLTLSNIQLELARHEPELRDLIRAELARFGLVVAGYSGRDPVVMDLLRSVLAGPHPYPAGLMWVKRPEDELSPTVRAFLLEAGNAGVEPVHVVTAGGFGELMTELGRACQRDITDDAWARLATLRPPAPRRPAARPEGPTQTYPQVRFGAVEVEALPTEARLLEASPLPPLPEVRHALRSAEVRAAVGIVGGSLAAFGPDEGMRRALTPISVAVTAETILLDFDSGSSATLGMALEALAQGLGATPGLTSVLSTNRRPMLRVRAPHKRAAGPDRSKSDPLPPAFDLLRKAVGGAVSGALKGPDSAQLPWAEAVTLTLERVADTWVLLFAPDIWVRPAYVSDHASAPSREEAQKAGAEFARERLARRYNRDTGAILDAWLRLIAGTGRTVRAFKTEIGHGVDAEFILRRPLLSRQLRAGWTVDGGR